MDSATAATWLRMIDDESYRAMAVGNLASNWFQQDPDAAMNWVERLPSGDMRDNAILNMTYLWRNPTTSQEALIQSIENREIRQAAVVRQIYAVMRSDPARARQIFEEADLPAHKRQQIEMMFNNSVGRF